MKPKTVLIGMPCGSGVVPSIMLQSLLQLQKPLPSAFMVVDRQRVDKARNAITMEALSKGFDYLLFVDDDNPIPEDTLVKFIEDDKDIVIAPIMGRNPDASGNHTLCAFYAEEKRMGFQKIRLYNHVTSFKDPEPLHRIDAGGTGCMLIKRAVLAALFKKYKNEMFAFTETVFKKKIVVNGKEYEKRTMSEDVEFCERAVDAGFEIWLDDRIRPMHFTKPSAIQWKPA